VSLGGVETLVTRVAATTHKSLSPEARAAAGISEGLVRVAVGLEDTEDLLEDFRQALDAGAAAAAAAEAGGTAVEGSEAGVDSNGVKQDAAGGGVGGVAHQNGSSNGV
jgi:hypothetical protein